MKRRPVLQPVSYRQTVSGHRESRVTPLVQCVRAGRVVELSRCFACAAWKGLVLDSETLSLSTTCANDEPDAPCAQSHEGKFPRDPRKQSVAEVMQSSVTCFGRETTISRVAEVLTRSAIGGAPVVDESGHPVGVISLVDVVKTLSSPGGGPDGAAETVMTPTCCSLPESAEVGRAAAIMAFEGIHRLPIVSADSQVVGIVSATDIMRVVAKMCGFMVPEGGVEKSARYRERRDA